MFDLPTQSNADSSTAIFYGYKPPKYNHARFYDVNHSAFQEIREWVENQGRTVNMWVVSRPRHYFFENQSKKRQKNPTPENMVRIKCMIVEVEDDFAPAYKLRWGY